MPSGVVQIAALAALGGERGGAKGIEAKFGIDAMRGRIRQTARRRQPGCWDKCGRFIQLPSLFHFIELQKALLLTMVREEMPSLIRLNSSTILREVILIAKFFDFLMTGTNHPSYCSTVGNQTAWFTWAICQPSIISSVVSTTIHFYSVDMY